MSTTTASRLLTADEFFRLPDQGRPVELVRGKLIFMNPPGVRHGRVCLMLGHLIQSFLDEHDLGRAVCNDAGVVTEHDPDTVRGADVSYYSYQRIPKDQPLPETYHEFAPEIALEVLSPDDRRKDVLAKVAEYLGSGVLIVGVADPQRETVTLYYPDRPEETFSVDQAVSWPAILPGFTLPLRRVFS